MYQYITHGVIAFLMFSETNIGEFEPRSLEDVNAVLSDVVTTGHRHGVRISIALGGATDFGFLDLMTSIGNDPANPLLDRVVQNVVSFVNSHGLDGVDLDLECWWGRLGENDQGGRLRSEGPHPAGYALTLFAQRLKQAMPDKLVSAAVFGTSWYGNNYDPRIAEYVDWLGVMTYDLTGSWNDSPVGPHTALFKIRNLDAYAAEQQGEWPGRGPADNPILSVEDSLWYWTNPSFMNWQGPGQNIPRSKIAAGVPIYGYDFAYGKDPDDLSGQVPPGYRSMRYRDILGQFPDAHTAPGANIKRAGSAPRPPFVQASGEYPYTNNIYFETPRTASIKLLFLMNVGAQGVIIWELSNDVWEEPRSITRELYRNAGISNRPEAPAGPAPSLPANVYRVPSTNFTLPHLSVPGTPTIPVTFTDSANPGAGRTRREVRIPIGEDPLSQPRTTYDVVGNIIELDYISIPSELLGRGLSDLMMNAVASDALEKNVNVIRLLNPGMEGTVQRFFTRIGFHFQPDQSARAVEINTGVSYSALNQPYPPPQNILDANWRLLIGYWEAPPLSILQATTPNIIRNFIDPGPAVTPPTSRPPLA